eukprot:1890875-Rhodomonas_salina.3
MNDPGNSAPPELILRTQPPLMLSAENAGSNEIESGHHLTPSVHQGLVVFAPPQNLDSRSGGTTLDGVAKAFLDAATLQIGPVNGPVHQKPFERVCRGLVLAFLVECGEGVVQFASRGQYLTFLLSQPFLIAKYGRDEAGARSFQKNCSTMLADCKVKISKCRKRRAGYGEVLTYLSGDFFVAEAQAAVPEPEMEIEDETMAGNEESTAGGDIALNSNE